MQSAWVLVETAARLLSPLALREFLRWLQSDAAAGAAAGGGLWRGWMWAVAVAAGGGSLTLIHHAFFWVGMRLGYVMRQQVVAAIHLKVLRLNSAGVARASTGHVVNLASNDVRRLDDALPFWVYTWSAPLETVMVLVMVARELGWAPAAAGVAAMLAVMPLQALLVQFVGGLRRATAARADERVRLTGEVISGALAMKMLGWEDPFAEAICGIRKKVRRRRPGAVQGMCAWGCVSAVCGRVLNNASNRQLCPLNHPLTQHTPLLLQSTHRRTHVLQTPTRRRSRTRAAWRRSARSTSRCSSR